MFRQAARPTRGPIRFAERDSVRRDSPGQPELFHDRSELESTL